jgi:small conductance mechanosensitive channel
MTLLRDIVLILGVAVTAHLATMLVRGLSRRVLRLRLHSEAKVLTVTAFTTSLIVFAIYFGAVGYVLTRLGVSLTTYLASASVIGLAVSFGSQGVVQDVITGLTVVLSDLLDVGDMVEIGGQTGIVEHVGMRFTVLVGFSGATVFVPNRTIAHVINYPKGFVRAYLDARVPADPAHAEEAERCLRETAEAAYDQFPGVMLLPPTFEGRIATRGADVFRVKFRIWPGQAGLLETAIKPAAVWTLKRIDPTYEPWMISVHFRAEPPDGRPDRRLPKPAALLRRDRPARPARRRGHPDSDAP